MRKIFIILVEMLLLFSCVSNVGNNSINLDELQNVSILDFIDSINVVQLETNDQCLISTINKVIIFNDCFYVLDIRQQSVFCFNSSGKFLFKIFQKGQGPEEYVYLNDLNIDPYNDVLLLLEPFGNLLSYDLNGQYLSKTSLPKEIVAYNEVFPINKDTLLFISANKYSVIYYSRKEKKIIAKKYENDRQLLPFNSIRKTYVYNDSVYYFPPLSNDVINLSGKEQQISHTWDFGKLNNSEKKKDDFKKLPKNQQGNSKIDYVGEKILNYEISKNYESSKYRICVIDYGNYNFRHILIDKVTGNSFVFDKTKENIRFIFPDFYKESIIFYDHGFGESPLEVKFYDREILNESQKKIIDSHDPENDNPFLVIYTLKKK